MKLMKSQVVAQAIAVLLGVVAVAAAKVVLEGDVIASDTFYGLDDADMQDLSCAEGSFITAISGHVTSRLGTLQITCSDGQKLDCIGTYCNAWSASQESSVIDAPDYDIGLKKFTMTSANGFDNLWIEFGGNNQDVLSLKSYVDGHDQFIRPFNTIDQGTSSVWPSKTDLSTNDNARLVLVKFDYALREDGKSFESIQPYYQKSTGYTPTPAAQEPNTLNFAEGKHNLVSEETFGKNAAGTEFSFNCTDGNFIYKIEAIVTENVRGLRYTCSDGAVSECSGPDCDSMTKETADKYNGRITPTTDYPVWYTAVAPSGFRHLIVKIKDGHQALAGIMTPDSVTDQLTTDIDVGGLDAGYWTKWPSVDNVSGEETAVLTGMKIYYDNDIGQIVPLYGEVLKYDTITPPPPASDYSATATLATQSACSSAITVTGYETIVLPSGQSSVTATSACYTPVTVTGYTTSVLQSGVSVVTHDPYATFWQSLSGHASATPDVSEIYHTTDSVTSGPIHTPDYGSVSEHLSETNVVMPTDESGSTISATCTITMTRQHITGTDVYPTHVIPSSVVESPVYPFGSPPSNPYAPKVSQMPHNPYMPTPPPSDPSHETYGTTPSTDPSQGTYGSVPPPPVDPSQGTYGAPPPPVDPATSHPPSGPYGASPPPAVDPSTGLPYCDEVDSSAYVPEPVQHDSYLADGQSAGGNDTHTSSGDNSSVTVGEGTDESVTIPDDEQLGGQSNGSSSSGAGLITSTAMMTFVLGAFMII